MTTNRVYGNENAIHQALNIFFYLALHNGLNQLTYYILLLQRLSEWETKVLKN